MRGTIKHNGAIVMKEVEIRDGGKILGRRSGLVSFGSDRADRLLGEDCLLELEDGRICEIRIKAIDTKSSRFGSVRRIVFIYL